MKELLIATGNKGKLKEFQNFFKDYSFNCISTEKFNLTEPEENGSTFEENAKIKSLYYFSKTNLPSLADDSGLAIDQLDGEPGIFSARWAGEDKDFSLAIEKIRQKLLNKKIDLNNVTGKFICSLCLSFDQETNHIFTGEIKGKITFPAQGNNGFGYDPIFIPLDSNKTFAQMLPQEKEKYSHRSLALEKLKTFLNS